MDRNTIIGLLLIFGLLLVWQYLTQPSSEEMAEQQRMQDSIALAQRQADSITRLELAQQKKNQVEAEVSALQDTLIDSVQVRQKNAAAYGPFAAAADGHKQTYTLENDLMEVTFTNKGGRIAEVVLKDYYKLIEDKKHKELKIPLRLLEDPKNKFEYLLPLAGTKQGQVSTEDLYFEADVQGQTIVFRAPASDGRVVEQRYTLHPGTYLMDYALQLKGFSSAASSGEFMLNWENYLDKIERNTQYERNYSCLYYRDLEGDVDYCSCTKDDEEQLAETRLKWIAHTNQFFNASLFAGEEGFRQAELRNVLVEEESENLKKMVSRVAIPMEAASAGEGYAMQWYIGPNEFKRLRQVGYGLEEVIPFGWSIFGTINRWIIRPLFDFLLRFIGSAGIVILVLTFLVKLALYPLTYRMLYSQSKMGALKPKMESLKAKYKDDQQQYQMETMKIYREFGVSPFGGCLPMVLQMPIWFALYRFFPAAIDFRQASFLWATDLSSYDVFFRLPFEIPFGFGSHISLFTLLWAVTTLIYTYYNTRHMDMSANPAMKYMQYIMPIFFLGFFNSFASGLTCYLLFSNLINIAQTIITKNFVINQEKIREELEAYRKKPKKKKRGFQQRLEEALKEQQRIQAERSGQQQTQKKKGGGGKRGGGKR